MSMSHQHGPACSCDDCCARPLTRNHYFTGKLLVERDFTDEQFYFREKIRLHHQRLHGTGVVCGLDIRQYPNAACQNQLVILEPGSAIDCCGHDILVAEKDTYDFTKASEVAALIKNGDTLTHSLDFMLSWRECPTEEIPVLYDECGCDDTQCAPNRILESFALEVLVDRPAPKPPVVTPKFTWNNSISIAHASAVALDENNKRIFVGAGNASAATLYQVTTDHMVIEASYVLGQGGLALAISPDGETVYVGAAPASAGNPPELWVFTPDAGGGISAGPARKSPLTGAGSADLLAMTVAADGRLLVVDTTSGESFLFSAGVPDPATPTATFSLGGASTAGVFSSDGKTVWFGQPGSTTLNSVDLTAATLTPTATTVTGIHADGLALVSSGSGADLLAVIDQSATSLHLVDPTTSSVTVQATLANQPQSVTVAYGGGLAIVTEAPSGAPSNPGNFQGVNLLALQNGTAGAVTAAFPVGENLQAPVLTRSALTLYAPFSGDPTQAASGAVAIIDLTPIDCRDALLGGDCPACVPPDGLLLARVENWQVGNKLEDSTASAGAGVSIIDNSVRTILASTQAITQALLCLMNQANAGIQAPQPSTGPSTSPTDLTGIQSVSWIKNGGTVTAVASGQLNSFIVAFSAPVESINVNDQTVALLIPNNNTPGSTAQTSWSQYGTAEPWEVPTLGVASGGSIATGGTCNAACVSAMTPQGGMNQGGSAIVRFQVHGDLIPDTNGNSVDGNHLAPYLPQRTTGDGIAGGLFESWFTVVT